MEATQITEIVSEAQATAEYLLNNGPTQEDLGEGERIVYLVGASFGPDQHARADEHVFFNALVEALGERPVPIIRTRNGAGDHFYRVGLGDVIRQGMINAGIED